MKRAALYARVSSDMQKKEGTIESQVAELRRQIKAAGDVIVKEYIDEGYSGASLDRPGMSELRQDLKRGIYDVIYALNTDRIARDVLYLNIVITDILIYKKRIIINGKDYIDNPENKFSLTVFGAVSQFERAKIAERTKRGRLHHLRIGELAGPGHNIYGYNYIKKSGAVPATLVINKEECRIVRRIFELYVSGVGQGAICRILEAEHIRTRTGNTSWDQSRITQMLRNPTYVGLRYYNKNTTVKEASKEGRKPKKKSQQRDPGEWISLKVPAIVSTDLFDKAQARLLLTAGRYRKQPTQSLLAGFVQCAECERLYASAYAFVKAIQSSGEVSVYERGQYRCTTVVENRIHTPENRGRCHNPRIETNILDGTVVELMQKIMLNPKKLRLLVKGHIETSNAARERGQITQEINALNEKRQGIFTSYATGRTTAEEYIAASRAIDKALVRLQHKKTTVVGTTQYREPEDILSASIQQFCASAKAQFEACGDFDAKRAFLKEYVERIIFDHGKITIIGNVPIQSSAVKSAVLPFRIEGEIDKELVRTKSSRIRWPQDGRFGVWTPAVSFKKVLKTTPAASAIA